jgi:peroxiredoxin
VDTPQQSREVVSADGLRFRILADTSRDVVRSYGLLHPHGAPDGSDIAVPAQFLLRKDGSIAWRHVSSKVQDRVDPAEVEAAIGAL